MICNQIHHQVAGCLLALFISSGLAAKQKEAEPAKKVLFDFEAKGALDSWQSSDGVKLDINQIPNDKSAEETVPVGRFLRINAATSGSIKSLSKTIDKDWTRYGELSMWVYQQSSESDSRIGLLEFRLKTGEGQPYWRQKIEVKHTGWQKLKFPLKWFRPGDVRVPRWDNLDHLELFISTSGSFGIDQVELTHGSTPFVTSEDIVEVAFPGANPKTICKHQQKDICILTNESELDLKLLGNKLEKTADLVTKALSLPEPRQGRTPTLVVFAKRQQYQAYPAHLAERLNVQPILPTSSGFSTDGVGTSYWDPIQRENRPVYTHEFIHSLLECTTGINCRGDWLHEGIATRFQVILHPSPTYADAVRKGFKGNPVPLSRLCNGSAINTSQYWQAATLLDMLLAKAKYKEKIPRLIKALSESETTDLRKHTKLVLGEDIESLEREWKAFCAEQFHAEIDGVAPGNQVKLPANVTVHGISVYQPQTSGFDIKEVTDWPAFSARLRAAAKTNDGSALRVLSRLPESAQEVIMSERTGYSVKAPREISSEQVKAMWADRKTLSEGFSKLLDDDTLYQPNDFKDLPIAMQLEQLLKKGSKRSNLDTRLMNRLVMRAAFPKFFRSEPIDPSEVVVQVEYQGPVVLVLTGYESCNWIVKTKPGAEVVWVILSGYKHQQVSGVNCIITQVGRLSEDKEHYVKCLKVYDVNSPEYPRYAARINELTGRSLGSFQGASVYSGSPFRIQVK